MLKININKIINVKDIDTIRLYRKLELTEALYRSLPTSLTALFLVVSVIVWGLNDNIEIKYLYEWYFILCGIIVCRYGLLIWYNHTKLQINLQKYHYYFFVLGSSLTGIFVGMLGSFLMPNDIMHQAFVLILISGILAGSVQSLSASYFANIMYICLIMIPMLTWEFIQILNKMPIFIGVFITMVLFCTFSLVVARHGYLMLVKHLELEFNYKILLQRVTRLKNKYKEQATHDLLTGLYNRQFLYEYFEIELNRAKRKNLNISIIMLDIDFFKNFNDTYGHECGDQILQSISNLLNQNIRKSDIACRYGGEEFVILMPETTLEAAREVAEKLRKAIKSISLFRESETVKNITLSFGVSSFPRNGLTRMKIIESADKALYRAKREGRDKVCIAT